MVNIKHKLSFQLGKYLAPHIMLIRPTSPYYLTTNSLLYFDEEVVLIDAGRQVNNNQLQQLKDNIEVNHLLFSHYHIDHILGSHLFPSAMKLIHENEFAALQSLGDYLDFCIQDHYISTELQQSWVQRLNEFLQIEQLKGWKELNLTNISHFKNSSTIKLGMTDLEIIHLPGHSPGHCGVYDPLSNILFIGDIEISGKIGPWYGWPNSDLIAFRNSVQFLIDFITNNEISLIVSSHFHELTKDQGLTRLRAFNRFFDIRKQDILDYISSHNNGVTLMQIVNQSFIYKGKRRFPPFVREFFELIHIKEHIKELIDRDLVQMEEDLVKKL
jgi:glyoxylase-like metal-dependent hydrolase (beta-lactamase superfamily II)